MTLIHTIQALNVITMLVLWWSVGLNVKARRKLIATSAELSTKMLLLDGMTKALKQIQDGATNHKNSENMIKDPTETQHSQGVTHYEPHTYPYKRKIF